MRQFLLLLTCLTSLILSVKAQRKLKVQVFLPDSTKAANFPLFIIHQQDTLNTVVTNNNGIAFFKLYDSMVATNYFKVSSKSLNYASFIKVYGLENSDIQILPDIYLSKKTTQIDEIIVRAKTDMKVTEDTVTYAADAYGVSKNAVAEDLLKKLPGVEVDREGNVTAYGKQVTKVRVNGKDFFGGDIKAATKEIPVELLDKVQILDDYGDQANFTGARDGDPDKVINFVFKKNRNQGIFCNAKLGFGTQQTYDGNFSLNKFKEEQQLSVQLNANDINANNFSGFSGGNTIAMIGGGRGGGGNTGNSGFDFSNLNNNNNGITHTASIALNYRDNWSTKTQANGSYTLTRNNNNTITLQEQNSVFKNVTNLTRQDIKEQSTAWNHRLNFNIEVKKDSNNYLKFSPQITYRVKNQERNTNFQIDQLNGVTIRNIGTNFQDALQQSLNLSHSFLWNHKFKKPRRTSSAELNTSWGRTSNLDSIQNTNDLLDTNGISILNNKLNQFINKLNEAPSASLRLTYAEPITPKSEIEISARIGYDLKTIDRAVNIRPINSLNYEYIDSLSTLIDNEFSTYRLGVNYRTIFTKSTLSAGIAVQPSIMNTKDDINPNGVNRNLFNFFPTVYYQYKMAKSKTLSINLNGRTNQPSLNQLQQVIDISNPQNIVIGNPNLDPEFSASIRTRYNTFDQNKKKNFFIGANFNIVNNKIISNTKRIGIQSQETTYSNENGQRSAGINYSYSLPVMKNKLKLRFNGNVNNNRNISIIESVKNINLSTTASQRASLNWGVQDKYDIGLGGQYSLTNNTFSFSSDRNTTTQAYGLTSEGFVFLPLTFKLGYDLSVLYNTGFLRGINANPVLLNSYLEKSFLKSKKLTARLYLFDAFKQNLSVQRTIDANTITDTRTNMLTRYFMLSASYKISKFTGQKPEVDPIQGQPPFMRDGEPRRFH
jgi:hypothetical protein